MKKILFKNAPIDYQNIYCFDITEEYDIKRNYNIFKMIYGYVFAAVLPMDDIFDDEIIKSNYTICKKLTLTIWMKNKKESIQFSFLPQNKDVIYVRSIDFKKAYHALKKEKKKLEKIFEENYGVDYKKTIQDRVSNINKHLPPET